MTNLVGQSIGRYHIVEQLGQGGMAVVYKAFDTRLERDVAIKVIRTDAIPANLHSQMLRRFEREAKALAKMEHRSIVNIHDYGEIAPSGDSPHGAPYLVMEYLPGGTLKEWTKKPYPYPEAVRLLLPLARALEYAHAQGIVHRDVKPANILITRAGEPLLSDFGVAKILESEQATQLTSTGVGIGTPQYMAPEQWRGQALPQSDIYALGVVFFELVTGHTPYDADTPAAIFEKILVDPLPRPRQFVPELPEEVEKVIFKALAKKLEDRYANMGEFAAALEKLADFAFQQGEVGSRQILPPASISGAKRLDAQGKSRPASLPKWAWFAGGAGILVVGALIIAKILSAGYSGAGQPEVAAGNTPSQITGVTPTAMIESTTTPSQVPLTPIASDPAVLFFEDFEDGKTQKVTYISGDWKIVPDELGNQVYDMDNSNSSEFPGIEFGSKDWKDYEIKFRVRILDTGSKGWVIVYFRRGQDNTKQYAVSMDSTYQNVGLNYTQDSSGWRDITIREYRFDRNVWYWVRIEAQGTEIRVFIDDVPVINTDDTRYNAGNVIIQTGQYTHAQFDDIQVTALTK